MQPEHRNPWTTLSSEVKYDNPWIRITEHQVIHPSGNPGIYGVVHYHNLAVGVLPVDAEGYTWLVGQYRYPLDIYSWEIPEGGCRLGRETALEAAARELKEETGLTATHYSLLTRLHLSNSVSDEAAEIYLATGLTLGEAQPEESEELRLRRLPLSEAIDMALRGEITDAMSVAALFRTQLLRVEGKL